MNLHSAHKRFNRLFLFSFKFDFIFSILGNRPTLVIANQVDISQVSLDGKQNIRLVYGKAIGASIAVDVNPLDGFIYWADYVKGTISRAQMKNTSNVVVVANGKLTRSEGIAVDWVGNKLYWTNEGKCFVWTDYDVLFKNGCLFVCNLILIRFSSSYTSVYIFIRV